MAPPGRLKQIGQLGAPRCRPQVARDRDPFVAHAPQQREAAELMDDAVARAVIGAFGFEGAEQAIPDDEDTGIVAVEITRVDRVVDAVMRRRVHHRFEPARTAPDRFGMDPELIDQVRSTAEQHHRRVEPDQQQRHAEREAQREEPGPALPERGRQIIMLARMVVDVRRPEPADAMRAAVERVISQVVEDEAERPRPPRQRDRRDAQRVGGVVRADHRARDERADDRRPEPNARLVSVSRGS